MSNKTARQIMRSVELCLTADMSIDKVSDHLTMLHLPGAPVTDEHANPLGFVSEYDCLGQLVQSSYYSDNTALAEDVMTKKVIALSPDLTLIDLASQMNRDKLNVAPVIENGKIIGVITRGDVMRELVRDIDEHKVPV